MNCNFSIDQRTWTQALEVSYGNDFTDQRVWIYVFLHCKISLMHFCGNIRSLKNLRYFKKVLLYGSWTVTCLSIKVLKLELWKNHTVMFLETTEFELLFFSTARSHWFIFVGTSGLWKIWGISKKYCIWIMNCNFSIERSTWSLALKVSYGNISRDYRVWIYVLLHCKISFSHFCGNIRSLKNIRYFKNWLLLDHELSLFYPSKYLNLSFGSNKR